jgi:Tfp pilus assembly PilM family ATPase
MAGSFPPDVIVLDSESLIHVRMARGKKDPRIVQAKSYPLGAGTFVPAVVTPQLTNEASLADALHRLRVESGRGRWDRVSLLLPDCWFRINILDLPNFPESSKEAEDVVRWSLKRTMPIDSALLRVRHEVLSRNGNQSKVLAISAMHETLTAIEKAFEAAGIAVVLIEPIGLNIWNAITVREPSTTRDRIFFYIRDGEFTTAAFRGPQPLFIRSRSLNGDRTVEQEIKLSASYIRDTLRTDPIEQCYLSGSVDGNIAAVIGAEFGAPVRTIALSDFSERRPDGIGVDAYEAELTACIGVFTS